jgi:hypothetical protein
LLCLLFHHRPTPPISHPTTQPPDHPTTHSPTAKREAVAEKHAFLFFSHSFFSFFFFYSHSAAFSFRGWMKDGRALAMTNVVKCGLEESGNYSSKVHFFLLLLLLFLLLLLLLLLFTYLPTRPSPHDHPFARGSATLVELSIRSCVIFVWIKYVSLIYALFFPISPTLREFYWCD